MNFKEELQKKTEQIEIVIRKYLPKEEGYQKTVLQAMNYSVLAGGKRLRPMLMEESFRLFHGQGDVIEPFMAALEMIHNYSLVHDDLPAMDNDEFRRGRKTTWTVYGDGMAVLAGDGLLNLAFETAAGAFSYAKDFETSGKIARAIQILGAKSGVRGMIGGQTADIEAEDGKNPLTEELLLFIHENKTAALIQAAFMIGAVLAGADEQAVTQMEKAAYNIGIAFQIQDDILDVTSTTEILGKPVGSDEKNHKLTYVTLKGLTESKKEVARLSEEAIAILSSFENKNEFLLQLVTSLINREK
ncbi:MAG: polyprenyl synthetase family protein [Lachnospiraceae bacterium]|nr:polyprenyl synthetase family protein [Lachnospiraceae bacterium]MDD7626860.1 polyprenyl synthetase family protein [Lachnospiraceae bacterium]MDY4118579.1 farnesyl diphosphate synthase [Lachnospiraceae bacterium]